MGHRSRYSIFFLLVAIPLAAYPGEGLILADFNVPYFGDIVAETSFEVDFTFSIKTGELAECKLFLDGESIEFELGHFPHGQAWISDLANGDHVLELRVRTHDGRESIRRLPFRVDAKVGAEVNAEADVTPPKLTSKKQRLVLPHDRRKWVYIDIDEARELDEGSLKVWLNDEPKLEFCSIDRYQLYLDCHPHGTPGWQHGLWRLKIELADVSGNRAVETFVIDVVSEDRAE